MNTTKDNNLSNNDSNFARKSLISNISEVDIKKEIKKKQYADELKVQMELTKKKKQEEEMRRKKEEEKLETKIKIESDVVEKKDVKINEHKYNEIYKSSLGDNNYQNNNPNQTKSEIKIEDNSINNSVMKDNNVTQIDNNTTILNNNDSIIDSNVKLNNPNVSYYNEPSLYQRTNYSFYNPYANSRPQTSYNP